MQKCLHWSTLLAMIALSAVQSSTVQVVLAQHQLRKASVYYKSSSLYSFAVKNMANNWQSVLLSTLIKILRK